MKEGEKRPDGDGDPASIWSELGRHAGFGLTFAVATGIFLLAGWWVDGWMGSAPLFTIAGALLGAAAGFYHMYQHLVLMPRDRERSRDDEGSRGENE